eukprot:360078-Chlamydomonas_euryale.AAC.12
MLALKTSGPVVTYEQLLSRLSCALHIAAKAVSDSHQSDPIVAWQKYAHTFPSCALPAPVADTTGSIRQCARPSPSVYCRHTAATPPPRPELLHIRLRKRLKRDPASR